MQKLEHIASIRQPLKSEYLLDDVLVPSSGSVMAKVVVLSFLLVLKVILRDPPKIPRDHQRFPEITREYK